jgi:hypothetical protein
MNVDEAMDFETWVYKSNIEEKYQNFHDEYGDAAGLLSDYKEIHYQEYLEEFMRQLNLRSAYSESNLRSGL